MPSTPSNEEQLYLELLNRFRLEPDGEAARLTGVNAAPGVQNAINYFGVSVSAFSSQLAALSPVAPLAWNGNLADAADFHTQAMINADEQTHQAAGEPGLGQRATNAGYDWNALGENIFAFADTPEYGHAGFVIDWGYDTEDFNGGVRYDDWQTRGDGMQDPPGHRNSMMNAGFTEIGISVMAESDPATQVGPNLVTQDLGSRFGYQAQFVGVVINDADGDAFYDVGEGLGGVSVLLERSGGGSYSTTSWSSGGWQLAVPAGSYTITFSGGGLAAPVVESAVLGSVNVKVDAIGAPGSSSPTAGPDTLTGTAAGETINGLGGNDTIAGLGGNDVLIGGTGADALSGGTGDDRFYVDDAGDKVTELAGEGNDRIFTSVSYTLGAGVHVEMFTTDDNFNTTALNLTGNELGNLIYGNAGANMLNGAGGADTLTGFGGDDWYYVDNAADVVNESAGQGADYVFASVSYVLGATAEVERMATINEAATTAINLTGNGLTNFIYGNAGANVLDGRGGVDVLVGQGGNDWYFVDDAGDVVVEGAGGGTDRVFASRNYTLGAGVQVEMFTTDDNLSTKALRLTGNELANLIYGNAGLNVIDGKAGADTMVGFGGDDQYYVDNAGDAVVESAGGGNDRVFTGVSYALGAGVEVELFTTTDNLATTVINLTGNELANTIYGNAGANVLDGRAGADTLAGLEGDDWYKVDNAGDVVIESAGGGTADRVFASVSYALGAGVQVERLSTSDNLASTAINLTGNELANLIYGNAGANVLDGKGGADSLTGMAGADTFRFTTALGGGNVDYVSDYNVADDTIQLDDAVFAGLALGALSAGAFNTGAAASQADDRIIYNSASGALLFDADGLGGAAGVQFATLGAGLALTAADFVVI